MPWYRDPLVTWEMYETIPIIQRNTQKYQNITVTVQTKHPQLLIPTLLTYEYQKPTLHVD